MLLRTVAMSNGIVGFAVLNGVSASRSARDLGILPVSYDRHERGHEHEYEVSNVARLGRLRGGRSRTCPGRTCQDRHLNQGSGRRVSNLGQHRLDAGKAWPMAAIKHLDGWGQQATLHSG